MAGKSVEVHRELVLPKTGPLDELKIKSSYKLQVDLAGLDPKSPLAVEILTNFRKVLQNDLNATRKQHDTPCINIWKDAAALVVKGKATEDQIKKAGAKAQSDIVKLWNHFKIKSAKPRADRIITSMAKSAAKQAKEKAKTPVIKLSSDELKEDRVGILTAILGAVTVSVAGGPLTWLTEAIAGVAALTKGYKNAWSLSKSRSADLQDNLNKIDDGLAAALASLEKLMPHMDRLNVAQKETAATLVTANSELTAMEKKLTELEKRAKSEKAVREDDYLRSLRDDTRREAAKLEALRKALSAQDALEQSVQTAVNGIKAAVSTSKAKRGKWDKIMKGYDKISKDSNTFVATVSKVLGQLK